MTVSLEKQISDALEKILSDQRLNRYVDKSLQIPQVYFRSKDIRLIILGQDPTVKNPRSRADIKYVLNLNKSGNLKSYINRICLRLNIDLGKNVYATNYIKNFFITPPTQIKETGVFDDFARIWLPILKEELKPFKNQPVITLGQPVLTLLAEGNSLKLVREYWGYDKEWKSGKTLPFKYVLANENKLHMKVFPFPHQPSITKHFYRDRLNRYVDFMRECLGV